MCQIKRKYNLVVILFCAFKKDNKKVNHNNKCRCKLYL